MAVKNQDDHNDVADSIQKYSTILANVSTVSTFILTIFSLVTLSAVNIQPELLSVDDLASNWRFQALFLVFLFGGCFSWLQKHWHDQLGKGEEDIESRFEYYLYSSVFKGKRWWVTSVFLLLITLALTIFPLFTCVVLALFAIPFLSHIFLKDDELGGATWFQKLSWRFDEEHISNWNRAIQKRLIRSGEMSVWTDSFNGDNKNEINDALERFYQTHKETYSDKLKRDKEESYYQHGVDFVELRFENAESRIVYDKSQDDT